MSISTNATAASSSAPSPSRGEVDWLEGERRFPGELAPARRLTIIKVQSRAELSGRRRFGTRYSNSSAPLTARQAAEAVHGQWGIKNRLHWVPDVVFREDQLRLRKGHGATNMAVVRHFAINFVRSAKDKPSIMLRGKAAGWNPNYLAGLFNAAGR